MSIDATRADAAAIRDGATHLRRLTIADQYDGGQHPGHAFHQALILDELAVHVRTLPEEARRVIVDAAQVITRET